MTLARPAGECQGDRAGGPVPYWSDDRVALHVGDCLDVLRQMPDACVDSVVTDPPSGISFMGREWDGSRGGRDRWIAWLAERMAEACRVLKPGGHALVWSLPRTSGWTQMALEDAGFEVRDCIVHIFGTGYPKSRDISKDIDAAAGAERPVIGSRLGLPGVSRTGANLGAGFSRALEGRTDRPDPALDITGPATADAARWSGWGTALKPGQEIWWLARKPHAQAGNIEAIGSHLDRLESECRQLARSAVRSSALTQAGSPAAKTVSAPAPAATQPEGVRESRTPTGAAAGSSAPTDTSPSESMAGTFLSTVTSWRRCWAELCEAMSTSTTGTMSSTTTDLRTLSSCLAKITAESMPASPCHGSGAPSLVSAADSLFAGVLLNSRATLELSAIASASGGTPPASPAEDAPSHKPGQEMWWLVRKPIAGTVAATVLEHGTGALNIAACKVGAQQRTNNAGGSSSLQRVSRVESGYRPTVTASEGAGRWPANIVFTHSAACEVIGTRVIRGDPRSGQDRGERPGGFGDVGADGGTEKPNGTLHGDQVADVFACAPDCPVGELDRQSGVRAAGGAITGHEPSRRLGAGGIYGDAGSSRPEFAGYGDHGGASRFFHAFRYQAKAPSSERPRLEDGTAHETVKSLGLMRFLVTLITPPGGTVLDCFAGSGTTATACLVEGFDCVLIDDEEWHAELIRTRLRKDIQPVMFGAAS